MESKNTINAFDLNDLMYVPTSETALGIQRQYRRHFPQKTRYSEGEEMVINVHGRNFVDLRNSSLEFTITTAGDGGIIKWGSNTGSVINLIRRVRVIAPNGQEISRSEKANVLQYYLMRIKNGQHFKDNVGTLLDYENGFNLTGFPNVYNIPLRLIDPFFGTEQFLPPQVVENLRVEITFEKRETAFEYAVPDVCTGYTVSDPSIMLDSYTMSPAATKIINQMDPLIYQFQSYHHTLSGIDSASNSLDIQLSHSVSTALECFVVNRENSKISNNTANSFTSRIIEEGDQQIWSIGSIQMPQQPLRKVSQWVNNFYQVNQQLGNQGQDNLRLDFNDFVNAGYGHPSVDLRRSKYFDTSGIEISNQRELICQLKLIDSVETTSDMFCRYVGRIVIRGGSASIEN